MFEPPVRATDDGVELAIPSDERALLVRLLDELGEILTVPSGGEAVLAGDVAARLSPTVYEDDELEAQYQRLTGDELLTSRLNAIETVKAALADESPRLDADGANAFMRAVNTVRLVLGTMLGITEDDDEADAADEDDEEGEDSDGRPEYQLYAWLSWLLEWTVRSL